MRIASGGQAMAPMSAITQRSDQCKGRILNTATKNARAKVAEKAQNSASVAYHGARRRPLRRKIIAGILPQRAARFSQGQTGHSYPIPKAEIGKQSPLCDERGNLFRTC